MTRRGSGGGLICAYPMRNVKSSPAPPRTSKRAEPASSPVRPNNLPAIRACATSSTGSPTSGQTNLSDTPGPCSKPSTPQNAGCRQAPQLQMLSLSYTGEEPTPSNGNPRHRTASRITVYKPYRVYKTHSGASYTDCMHNPNLPPCRLASWATTRVPKASTGCGTSTNACAVGAGR